MLVRNTDQKSGKQLTLEGLKACTENNGSATSVEVAQACGMNRCIVARRLADIEKDGRAVRRGRKTCSVGGKRITAWVFCEEERDVSPVYEYAMKFARMAVMDLQEIMPTDPDRDEAFDHVQQWITHNR